MYLFYCILIGASLLSICLAESASNHPTSSQNYDHGDLSLSYKLNLIHIYTTLTPLRNSDRNSNQKQIRGLPQKPQAINYKNIQYAPLFLIPTQQSYSQNLNPQQESQKTVPYSETTTSAYENEKNDEKNSPQRQEQKRNLFPNFVVTGASDTRPRQYVPGYNVDLQSVKNKLMQNGIYASNPNFLVKNKQINVNYLQPQSPHQREDNLQGVSKSNDLKAKGIYSMLPYPQHVKKTNEDVLSGVQRVKRPFFYVKAPKVDLNLARAHSIARSAHKASVNVNSSFRKLPSLPDEFFSNTHIVQPSKTHLYPDQKRGVFMVRHTV